MQSNQDPNDVHIEMTEQQSKTSNTQVEAETFHSYKGRRGYHPSGQINTINAHKRSRRALKSTREIKVARYAPSRPSSPALNISIGTGMRPTIRSRGHVLLPSP